MATPWHEPGCPVALSTATPYTGDSPPPRCTCEGQPMASDPIDTDAIRGHYLSGVGLRRANWEAYIFGDIAALCDALDTARAALAGSEEPDMDPFAYQQRVVDALDRLAPVDPEKE